MDKDELDKYFYRIADHYLIASLDNWQITEIKKMLLKAYKKGKTD